MLFLCVEGKARSWVSPPISCQDLGPFSITAERQSGPDLPSLLLPDDDDGKMGLQLRLETRLDFGECEMRGTTSEGGKRITERQAKEGGLGGDPATRLHFFSVLVVEKDLGPALGPVLPLLPLLPHRHPHLESTLAL